LREEHRARVLIEKKPHYANGQIKIDFTGGHVVLQEATVALPYYRCAPATDTVG
jgi:hypothetical protein